MILPLNDSKIRVRRPDINEMQVPEIAGDVYETHSNPDRRKRRGCECGARDAGSIGNNVKLSTDMRPTDSLVACRRITVAWRGESSRKCDAERDKNR